MRKYSSNLAFVDLLFNLLVGFTSLFVIAFLLINPISKTGEVDPPVKMIIEMTWDNNSDADIDLHLRGPDLSWVYFGAKDNGYASLERDDLGWNSDTFVVNGEEVIVKRNYEVISVVLLPEGEYVINVHYFSREPVPEEVTVTVTTIGPYKVVYEGTVTLRARQQETVVSFVVNEKGKIVDVNTEVQIPLGSINRGAP